MECTLLDRDQNHSSVSLFDETGYQSIKTLSIAISISKELHCVSSMQAISRDPTSTTKSKRSQPTLSFRGTTEEEKKRREENGKSETRIRKITERSE